MWFHVVSMLPLSDLVSFSHTSKYNYSIMIVDLRKRYCAMIRKPLVAAPHPKVNTMIQLLRPLIIYFTWSLQNSIYSMRAFQLHEIRYRTTTDTNIHYSSDGLDFLLDELPNRPSNSIPPQKIVKHTKSQPVYRKQAFMRQCKHKKGHR